jgi:hypothetical protein
MAVRVIKYDPDFTFKGYAGEAIAEGDVCGISSAAKLNVFKADADATHGAAATNRALGIAVKAAAIGDPVHLAPICIVDGLTLTAGGKIYLSTTAGGYTQTQPTTNTFTVQELGIARTTTEALINVQSAFQFQTAGNSVTTFL